MDTALKTDSAAALRGFSSRQTVREDLMIEMQYRGEFCCVPAHNCVKGNEQAPLWPKKTLKGGDSHEQRSLIKVSYGGREAKLLGRTAILQSWQMEWVPDNKVRQYLNNIKN